MQAFPGAAPGPAALTWPPLPLQVAGERYVYKFVCEPEALFSMAFPEQPRLKAELELSEEDTLPLSHLGDSGSYLPELGSFPAQLYSKGYTY